MTLLDPLLVSPSYVQASLLPSSSDFLLPTNDSVAGVTVLVVSFELLGLSLAVLLGVMHFAAVLYLGILKPEFSDVAAAVFGILRSTTAGCRFLRDFTSPFCVASSAQAVSSLPVGFVSSACGSSANHALPDDNHRVRHLAVIMDGNRRYGKAASSGNPSPCAIQAPTDSALPQNLSVIRTLATSPLNGHRLGGEKLMEFIEYCIKNRVEMLTVYAFSTENWSRSKEEIDVLMFLFEHFFQKVRYMAKTHGIFIRFVATEPQLLPPHILQLMRTVEQETREITPRNIVVNCCVSYGGRSEIVHACRRLASRGGSSAITEAAILGEMLRSVTQDEHEEYDRSVVEAFGGCEPQVLLRTSGEARTSNFLMYESAYSEIMFLSKAWPEVNEADLKAVLCEFAARHRRFGK